MCCLEPFCVEEDTHKFKEQQVVISRFSSPQHSHERHLLIAVSGILVVNYRGIPDRKDSGVLQHKHRLVTAQPHLESSPGIGHILCSKKLGEVPGNQASDAFPPPDCDRSRGGGGKATQSIDRHFLVHEVSKSDQDSCTHGYHIQTIQLLLLP